MTQHQYRNPPIEEAVCEFRFAPGPAWNLTVPGLFYEKVKDSYTGEPRQQNLIATEIQPGHEPTNSEIKVRQEMIKLLIPSSDNQRLVGVGPDVLSVHVLRPYKGWDEFSQRIDQVFEDYTEVAKPIGINRIALRYINRIVIPSTQPIELIEYFTIATHIPEGLPSRISGFLTRIESHYEDIPIKLVLTFADAIAPVEQSEFILDLEISQDWVDKPLPLQEVHSNLYELKQRAWQAFETLITDRTKELFNVE
jgi:uncharacterized protein (TIGR04255 family)